MCGKEITGINQSDRVSKLIFTWACGLAMIVALFAAVTAFGFSNKPPKITIPAPVEVATPAPSPSPTATILPVTPVKYTADWNNAKWTEMLSTAIDVYGRDLILMDAPSDTANWCPKWTTMSYEKRKQALITMFVKMAYQESKWKPETSFKESFNDSKGERVISRGLFQLSIESGNQSAYNCKFKDPADVHDVQKNIECAVKISKRWVPKDEAWGHKSGGKHLGIGRYWSVGRDGSGSQPKVKAAMIAVCK